MATSAEKLDGIAFLAELSPESRASLAQRCRFRRFAAGDQVLDRESQSRDVFFVVSGRVDIVNYASTGREIAYASVSAGGYFGELSAIDGGPRSASAVAGTACEVASLAPDLFRQLLERHPQLMMQIVERLTRIIRECDDRIMDLSTQGAVQRVCSHLIHLAEPDPITSGSWVIYPMPTQSVIASRVSTTRETVARVLSQLTSDGLVRRKGKSLYLPDREALQKYIEHMGVSRTQDAR
jgi:CRP-like cAMP-binding protein